MTARFLDAQPPVRMVEKHGKVYVFICLNESVYEESYDFGEETLPTTVTVYEYDYHEFVEDLQNINAEDVQNNPEKYMSYAPKSESENVEDKLKRLEAQINALSAAQLDVATREV